MLLFRVREKAEEVKQQQLTVKPTDYWPELTGELNDITDRACEVEFCSILL